ncbi:MAG: VWA domain-containing protein [Parvularculales bacterium]
MPAMLADFIKALRAADVRVSPAESIEAQKVLEIVGISDRVLFHDALSQSLAKTAEEKAVFSDVFDRFFSFDAFSGPTDTADTDEHGAPIGGLNTQTEIPQDSGLADLIASGDQAELARRLAVAAQAVDLNQIRLFTQSGLYTRRILDAMGEGNLTEAIIAAERADNNELQRSLTTLRERARKETSDYVQRQMALQTANAGRLVRTDILSRISLSNVEHGDFKLMRQLVRKMAKKLSSLHSRRRRRARRGHLDLRHTIRRNVRYDGVIFETLWKKTRIDRPKVVVICDVSGSVRAVARFLLMFLYSLTEVLPKVRAFAFSGDLAEVTDLFLKEDIETAIAETMRRHGGGATDYGAAMEGLESLILDDIDFHTTVILLGDARSNYGDPRTDIFKVISARARRLIWLNPEPRTLWDTGDSEMGRFAPYCHEVRTANTLRHLERIIDGLLKTAR